MAETQSCTLRRALSIPWYIAACCTTPVARREKRRGPTPIRSRCSTNSTSHPATTPSTVPHVMIYNRDGKVLASDDGPDKDGLHLLYDWMNAELNRSDQDRYASAG